MKYTIEELRTFHGKEYTAQIRKVPVNGKIAVTDKGNVHLCHDSRDCDGTKPSNRDLMSKHKYAWIIVENGAFISSIKDIVKLDVVVVPEVINTYSIY